MSDIDLTTLLVAIFGGGFGVKLLWDIIRGWTAKGDPLATQLQNQALASSAIDNLVAVHTRVVEENKRLAQLLKEERERSQEVEEQLKQQLKTLAAQVEELKGSGGSGGSTKNGGSKDS